MRLFEIDETHNVRPNRVWIDLIPEFSIILRRDKGSKGDSQGRSKLRARKELSYIYFMCDFSSPLRDWLYAEKRKESLYYAGLEEADIDEVVQAAVAKYIELQNKAARSLRTFQAVNKGLDQLDAYLESVNFQDTDRKGELVHDPNRISSLMERMTVLYQKRRDFEKFVEDDLKANPEAIQGNRTLGDQEAGSTMNKIVWSETDIIKGSDHAAATGTSSVKEGSTFEDIKKTINDSQLKLSEFSEKEIDEMNVFGEEID